MKNPMKLAKKELVKYGATIVTESRHAVVFDMPHGGRYTVGRSALLPRVRDVIQECHLISVGLRGYTAVAKPLIDPSRLRSADHFLLRLDLMHEQEGVTMREVLDVLAHPERVFATHNRQKIAVCGKRVTVVAAVDGSELVLTTLLWSTPALWERNPRPEE
ncbi:hypothetical protein ACSHWG_01115 [Leucobacter sp. Z1108]|uniref:hypothetical protein n=1 Tax=Leucobacter sp. Z1108 TaxID=3439066 RepID=UPI003F3A5891